VESNDIYKLEPTMVQGIYLGQWWKPLTTKLSTKGLLEQEDSLPFKIEDKIEEYMV
jgi:hypothetical protein